MKTTVTYALATILVAFAFTSEAVECPAENGELVTILPNPDDCTTYYMCNMGTAYLMECPPGLEFNAKLLVCDYRENSNCRTYSSSSPTEASTTEEEPTPAFEPTTAPEPDYI